MLFCISFFPFPFPFYPVVSSSLSIGKNLCFLLECAPCCVGQEFTEVWHGAGRVPDFAMAKAGAIIGGSAAENAQRVSGTAARSKNEGTKERVSAGRGRYAARGTTPDTGFKDTCFFEWRSLTAWHSKAFPEMMAMDIREMRAGVWRNLQLCKVCKLCLPMGRIVRLTFFAANCWV